MTPDQWAAHQRDVTRFLVIMCSVCACLGFMAGFVVCAIAGAL